MLQKYNDTAAAVALIIFLLGALFYVAQLLFTTESWLAQNGIGPEGIGLARVLGFTWLGISVGLILTFTKGPDGQHMFFIALLIAQIGIFLNLWHQHFIANNSTIFDDAIIVSVLTALLLFGYFKVRSRL